MTSRAPMMRLLFFFMVLFTSFAALANAQVGNPRLGGSNAIRPLQQPANSFNRNPMPCYMGVHQNASQSVFVNVSSLANNPFSWTNRNRLNNSQGHWIVTPLNNSLARIDWFFNNQFYALQAMGAQRPLQCVPVSSSLSQLWRLQRFPGNNSSFIFESLQYPGYCATFINDSIFLQPIAFLPTQQWWFDHPPTLSLPPILRNTSQQVVPNAPLPPATVSLINTSQDRVIALVAELQNPKAAQEIEIPAQGQATVQLQRDAGATIVESFEVVTAGGLWDRQERSYRIPPVPLYDISIYEVFLQSIAIDRTGTSPNPIEDINYQPRSIGIFQVPPGGQLPEVAQIDIMETARRSNNPGGVRPLPSKLKPAAASNAGPDPLKSILNEIQSRRKDF